MSQPSFAKKLTRWFPIILLFWIASVIAFYYVVHKPWGPVQGALLQVGRDGLGALALFSLAGGLGGWLANALGLGRLARLENRLERAAIAVALGLGALSLAALAAGLLGVLQAWAAWGALALGLLLLRKAAAGWIGDLCSAWERPEPGQALTLLERLAGGFVLLVLVLNLLRALAPPLKWDSLVYHLEIPQAYLAAGRIFFYPENIYAGFPQVVEVLFTWAMALGSVTTATVFGWAVSVAAFLGVEGFSRRLLGAAQGGRWLAPAILLSGYSISQAMNWAYLETWILLFGSAMLIALDYACSEPMAGDPPGRRAWLVCAGLLAGIAIGAKYTAGVLLPIGAIFILPVWDRKEPAHAGGPAAWRRWVGEVAILGGAAALLVLPWLAKNLFLMGNPFYPLLVSGDALDPWQQAFRSGPPPPRTLWQDLLLPFHATFFGIEGGMVEGLPEYGASLGPLLLALIPGLLVGWRDWGEQTRRSLARLLAVAASAWLLWSIAAHFADELMRPRHWFGVFGALAVLAAAGFQALSAVRLPGLRLGRALSALLALAIGLAGITELVEYSRADPLPVVLGDQSQADYLKQELGWYSSAIEAVNDLPAGSLVLFLWEPRTLYCTTPCLPDGKLDNWWYLRQAGGDAPGIAAVLRQKGVTHVLVGDSGLEWIRGVVADIPPADWEELDRFLQTHLQLIQAFGGGEDTPAVYSLYRFQDGGQE